MCEISYKSALFMMHRKRFAMADEAGTPELLNGTVEIDETYVGGKPRYVGKHNFLTRPDRKTPVVAMVQRGGEVRVSTMPTVNSKNLRRVIAESVHQDAQVVTDEARYYDFLRREHKGGHSRVNHRRREYVNGDVYTNTIESFFAILKRGINGTFHAVSKKHLHRYLAEFQHRYNTRALSDGERVVATIKKSQGKRLLYKQPLNI
jgi:transposase-like protein